MCVRAIWSWVMVVVEVVVVVARGARCGGCIGGRMRLGDDGCGEGRCVDWLLAGVLLLLLLLVVMVV